MKKETKNTTIHALILTAMGSNYRAEPGGIGNYRIRGLIKDANGTEWLIELSPTNSGTDKGGFWGEVYNLTAEENERCEYIKKMEELTAKYGSVNLIPVQEKPSFPQAQWRHIEETKDFTIANVLQWVNKTFDGDFDQINLVKPNEEPHFVNECHSTLRK